MNGQDRVRILGLLGLLLVTGCTINDNNRVENSDMPPATAPIVEATTRTVASSNVDLPASPAPKPDDHPLPINLPIALQLANVNALDIAAAADRIRIALAVQQQANVLWLPSLTLGGDYNRHDGKVQDIVGNVLEVNRTSMMFGLGSGIGSAAVLNVGEAIFAPLAARQQVSARQADKQVASNDTLYAVSEAYFNVQQARGELAGASAAVQKTTDVVKKTRQLAPSLVPELEIDRAEAELARLQQAEIRARERLKVASAELVRILLLDAAAIVEPAEPPHLRIELIDLKKPLEDLIPIALTSRPELASQQAQVQLTLTLLKQERFRPLIPSILLRGASTPVTGTLAAGVFGGGTNSTIANAGLRSDFDLQLLWQLDNLGFGNLGKIHQREEENRLALTNLMRIQYQVSAEVVQAHAQATLAAQRVEVAEKGVRFAVKSADKNILALGKTKGGANLTLLIIRPQEAVAAVQALAQAYNDFYSAVADANRAQFRLYRALGQPAQCLLQDPKTLTPETLHPTPGLLKSENTDKPTDKPVDKSADKAKTDPNADEPTDKKSDEKSEETLPLPESNEKAPKRENPITDKDLQQRV